MVYYAYMPYVITCGDEGVQINEGTRLGVVGAGVRFDGFPKILSALKKLLGDDIVVAASAENDWVRQQFDLSNWEQVNATMQQQAAALADKEGIAYAGFLPFADPKQLDHGVKGHMVRPQKVHIANKIMFTLAGGEQTYNLGQYLVSAEWVAAVPEKVAHEAIRTQVEHYQQLAGETKLQVVFEKTGPLGEKVAADNEAALKKLGITAG